METDDEDDEEDEQIDEQLAKDATPLFAVPLSMSGPQAPGMSPPFLLAVSPLRRSQGDQGCTPTGTAGSSPGCSMERTLAYSPHGLLTPSRCVAAAARSYIYK